MASSNQVLSTRWDWADQLYQILEEMSAVLPPLETFHRIPQDLLPVLDNAEVAGRILFMCTKAKGGTVEKSGYWPIEIITSEVQTGNNSSYYLKCSFVGFSKQDLTHLNLPSDFLIHARDLKTTSEINRIESNFSWIYSPPAMFNDAGKNLSAYERAVNADVRQDLLLPKYPEQTFLKFAKYCRGDVLEVRDEKHVNLYRSAVVIGCLGWKIQLSLDTGESARTQTFVDPDWAEIHPKGWCQKSGARMTLKSPTNPSLEPLTEQQNHYGIKVGDVFECVHPISMDEIAAAEVTQILSDGFFMYKILTVEEEDLIEYGNRTNEFHTHIESPTIMPCNYCQDACRKDCLTVPNDWVELVTHTWDQYLEKTGKTALKFPEDIVQAHESYNNPWTVGTLLEATDLLATEVVNPAIITETLSNRLFKIHFIGWSGNYDQWRAVRNPLVYPVGWCKLMGYPLSPPGGQCEVKYLPDLPDSFYKALAEREAAEVTDKANANAP